MWQVPARFKHIHEKHKSICSCDVDATVKSLAVGLKKMQSLWMSALLNDVDAALKEEASANINFCSDDSDVAKGDKRETKPRDAETNVHSVVDEEQNTDGVAANGVDVDMDDGGAAKGVAVDTEELCSDDDDIDNTNFELLAHEAREDNLSHSTVPDAPQAAVIVYESGAEDIHEYCRQSCEIAYWVRTHKKCILLRRP
jgi:hypothetical protein